MSWLNKLLPPKINRDQSGARRNTLPEGLWSKCPACEAVLYATDLEANLQVCPKCGHHLRLKARQRLDMLLDREDRQEIGAEVVPIDSLKFRDSKTYPARLKEAAENSGETDALVVMRGSVKTLPLIVACFEFDFMGGSMGSVLGERFIRGVRAALADSLPFVCITASGGARMQEGLFSLMQMA
ncbi:MAG: acetyl-CoA carboxylase carboxyl transferase subunit beta, partial [Zoogloeaceae bacterium]|nr:acetyl-CoA carboxylase carboxyl transferase subunit beta [Zoogloeaceae bacterium]